MTVLDVFWHLIDPILFMCLSASFIPRTIYNCFLRQNFHPFTSISLFKDAWFAEFWGKVGPQTRENASARAAPLIAQAHGAVLDIGPGSGEWLHEFSRDKVTKIYGVEPNRDHHAALKRKVKEAGLEGVYEIVPVGVEDLGEKWVGMGEVDSVVTIQCLCSIPRPRSMIGGLYGYLKEGGMWIVYEHVVAFGHQGRLMSWYQAALDVVWPHFLGGCSITRDTEGWLKSAGKWSKIDLYQPSDEPVYHVIPHTMGILTK